MSVLIELTLVKSVNPDEVKELLIDFLKTSSHLFKSFNIRFLDVGGSDSFEDKLVNLTDASEDFGCTTCCLEDMEEPIMMYFDTSLSSPNPNGILFQDSSYTNQESNSTFYMDCENHSNAIVKEEASTFVLKREPSMDVSSLQQFYTKTTSKRKSLLKELPFFTERPELIQQNDVGTIKVTENCAMANTTNSDIRCDVSTNSKDEFTQPAELLEESYTNNEISNISNGGRVESENDPDDKISNIDDSSSGRSALNEFEKVLTAKVQEEEGTEKDLEDIDNISNGAVEDSSFDRSSLYESQNELEVVEKEEQMAVGASHHIAEDCHIRAVHPGNLVDILEAAKRGDLTIERNADETYMNLDGFIVEDCSGNYDENLFRVYDQLNMNNVSKGKRERVFWKQVKCQSCSSKRFASFEDAIVHVLAMHCDKTLPRIYRCSLCSTTSFYKRNLRKVHLKRKHNIQYWRHRARAEIVEKWHPSTLLEALEASKREFPKIWPIIERFLVWVVKSGKLDTEVSKTS
ncbi:unnamed protein product, partial [Mesorhabditis belari]|uniref:C2H2-type domain-containing protein n=1 Tax=Mesorhabditis belari TaxID=2138241 RepID=A0AAF3F4V4_9BILA